MASSPTSAGGQSGIVRRRSTGALASRGASAAHDGPRNTLIRAGSTALHATSPLASKSQRGGILRERNTVDVVDADAPDKTSAISRRAAKPHRRATVDGTAFAHVTKEKAAAAARSVEEAKSTARSVSTPGSDVRAATLARRYRLSLSEVKHVFEAFENAKKNETGGLDLAEFRAVMCRVFDVPDVKEQVLQSAYAASSAEQTLNYDDFMAWYVANMFCDVTQLNGSPEQSQGNALTYNLAEKFAVDVSTIDKIKGKFDKFDLDKSGGIDFKEFTEMMEIMLKARQGEIGDVRLRKFWREIDTNRNGVIDFTEFTAWYLRNFNTDANPEDEGAAGPVEAMYSQFSPTVQRGAYLDKQSMAAFLEGLYD